MIKRSKVKVVISFVILAIVALWIYRSTGTGYVWAVSGVSIPWPREDTEGFDCDFGYYSVIKLSPESMDSFVHDHPWSTVRTPGEYHNDCLMFDGLRTAKPLPEVGELIWMQGANRYEDWIMYLHVPTHRLFVSIRHPDLSGDYTPRATENRQGEQAAPRNR